MEKNKHQLFLLSFFPQATSQYEEKEVNGFWLVKQQHGITKEWRVFIYTQESFKKYKDFQKKYLHK